MKISQIPVGPQFRIGWRRPSQWLKLPTTLTRRAFGAQTAKWTPRNPSCVAEVGAEPLEVAVVRPLAEQVEVEVGQDRAEPVGVDELPGVPLVVLDGQAVGERLGRPGKTASKRPSGWIRSIGTRTPGSPLARSTTQACCASGRNARIDPRGLAVALDLVRAEDRERVPVVGVDQVVDDLLGDGRAAPLRSGSSSSARSVVFIRRGSSHPAHLSHARDRPQPSCPSRPIAGSRRSRPSPRRSTARRTGRRSIPGRGCRRVGPPSRSGR